MTLLPAASYLSGNWIIPTPVSIPEFSSPIPTVNVPYVCEVEYCILASKFQPCALSTKFNDPATNPLFATLEEAFTVQSLNYANFYLVAESSRIVQGLTVRWKRTYAAVPEQYTEPTSVDYSFIAFYPGVTTVTDGLPDAGRGAQQQNASGICVYDFAIVTDSATLDALLPPLSAQFYGFQTVSPTPAYIPYTETNQLYPAGSPNAQTNSYPTLEQYKAWISVTQAGVLPVTPPDPNPQTADQPFPRNYMLRALDADRYLWMGQIWARRSIYINPQ